MQSGFTILEHPSDIGIEARGTTLAEAFENAARGMMAVILDTASLQSADSSELILDAGDVEQLLVRWLAEILYYFDGRKFLAKDFIIRRISPIHLEATIKGEKYNSNKHRTNLDVKAVTYHQLCVQKEEEGWYVRVFLDI